MIKSKKFSLRLLMVVWIIGGILGWIIAQDFLVSSAAAQVNPLPASTKKPPDIERLEKQKTPIKKTQKQLKVDELLNIPIEVILGRCPEASQVFLSYRMGFIGCAFSRFHTPQDAIESYQLDKGSFLRCLGDLMHPTDEQDT